jgi:hypothetical protein
MAGKLVTSIKLRKALGWAALAIGVITPAMLAGSAVFGTFNVDLERRENISDLSHRKALARDLVGNSAEKPNALLTKPLFVAGRMPIKIEAPPQPLIVSPVVAETVTPPSYRVGGVMIALHSRKVLLRTPELTGGQWLSEGEVTAQGWTVASIETNRVALARGAQRISLDLYTPR